VIELGFFFALQFRNNAFCEHLAQFDAPLVKRIDAPDGALREYRVFIKRDQLAERFRRQTVREDRVRWPITFENPVRDDRIRRALRLDLFACLAERQRFSLREDIRHQDVVMLTQRIQRMAERDEVARNEPGPLVNKLIERVLAVCARFGPNK